MSLEAVGMWLLGLMVLAMLMLPLLVTGILRGWPEWDWQWGWLVLLIWFVALTSVHPAFWAVVILGLGWLLRERRRLGMGGPPYWREFLVKAVVANAAFSSVAMLHLIGSVLLLWQGPTPSPTTVRTVEIVLFCQACVAVGAVLLWPWRRLEADLVLRCPLRRLVGALVLLGLLWGWLLAMWHGYHRMRDQMLYLIAITFGSPRLPGWPQEDWGQAAQEWLAPLAAGVFILTLLQFLWNGVVGAERSQEVADV